MTIREEILNASRILEAANIENASYDAKELMLHCLNISSTDFFLKREESIDEETKLRYEALINRRASHEPLQHITGIAYFYGREFNVNSSVLIPRYDTENLVERVLKLVKRGDHILDMCTGSGCIIETIALESRLTREEAVFLGVDISKEALKVARANKEKLGADAVDFMQSDLFENLNDNLRNSFDIIVSNPPYIKTAVIEELDKEVKLHDPYIALDGSSDGLKFYKKITEEAIHFLKKDGYLAYEIGSDQAEEVRDIMASKGFVNIEVYKDLSGLDRVVIAKLEDGL
ncbi:peptide chain release factor N(5)-glutamine methyltransferase [Lachnospira multipara]|uniref:Release factor glutamine methyltransferase n=1 Tax=Lachnospira multipara TaxID=28051 RepID=A0A1H5WQ58_9FIRM|nr:peptide chain release factor N(5)-glutamine methyltransferase [Lachnospira multipara]SEG01376.1 release factor glutamine methyltransferase [Lachnospira multipara]